MVSPLLKLVTSKVYQRSVSAHLLPLCVEELSSVPGHRDADTELSKCFQTH